MSKRSFFNDGYLDCQKYLECQLVTIINAAIHLGEQPVDPHSEEYERLIDIGGARHGAAIRPEYVMDYLRIEAVPTDPGWKTLKLHLSRGFPVEYGLSHPGVGFHSVLVIGCTDADVRPKRRVRVANLAGSTDEHMWMDWDEFKESWYFLSNWEARCFRLKKEREIDLLIKKMKVLGYPKEWFSRKHKKFGGRSPYEIMRGGREGIDEIRTEVDRRVKWTDKKRAKEIRKITARKRLGKPSMDDVVSAAGRDEMVDIVAEALKRPDVLAKISEKSGD